MCTQCSRKQINVFRGNVSAGFTAATADAGGADTPTSTCSTPMASRRSASPEPPDPAKPITDVSTLHALSLSASLLDCARVVSQQRCPQAPGAQAVRIGFVLRHLLVAGFAPESLRGALTIEGQIIFTRGRRAWTGSDLVDWLIEVSGGLVRSRQQACAMWQCLLEEGVILHGESRQGPPSRDPVRSVSTHFIEYCTRYGLNQCGMQVKRRLPCPSC